MNNITNITFSFNNSFQSYGMNPNLPAECWHTDSYSLECITQAICPQLSSHIIKIGLIIVISYAIISWFKWWFFNHGYKKFNLPYFDDIKHRLYWNMWIQDRLIKFMVLYIAMVVYFSWRLL